MNTCFEMALMIYLMLFGYLQQTLEGKVSNGKFFDCGEENKRLTFSAGSIEPNPIQYPGNMTIAINFVVLHDLPPTKFEMQMNVEKLKPMQMPVGCFYPIGSCHYDVCSEIMNYKDLFCPSFPNPNECGCPIKAATYEINFTIPILDYGEIFLNILQGYYKGNMNFFDNSSNTKIGCIEFAFEVPGSGIVSMIVGYGLYILGHLNTILYVGISLAICISASCMIFLLYKRKSSNDFPQASNEGDSTMYTETTKL